MNSFFEKVLVGASSALVGFFSSKIGINDDFLWSLRGILIPVLITLLSLYSTLSINLIKELDGFSGKLRKDAMALLSAMKFELRFELVSLLFTFLLIIISPLLISQGWLVCLYRPIIDGLIVFDVTLFIILILDTFFSYLDLVKLKGNES